MTTQNFKALKPLRRKQLREAMEKQRKTANNLNDLLQVAYFHNLTSLDIKSIIDARDFLNENASKLDQWLKKTEPLF